MDQKSACLLEMLEEEPTRGRTWRKEEEKKNYRKVEERKVQAQRI